MKNILIVVLFVLTGCASLDKVGQTSYPSVPELPGDILTGKLPGGETFYFKKNPKPENRVHLRLVVKAGSLEEADDQRGLAHFVEHMAFNGTRTYPKNEIIHFFESIGMKFGDNLNAFTSFDRTIYTLDIPANDPDILKKALQVMEDWAYGITFDPEEVEKEKGVILEEARNQDNVWGRFNEFNYPLLFRESRYANRLPIGLPEVIKSATAEKLKAYYRTWYRPENIALVVVGTLEPQAILANIEGSFKGKVELLPSQARVEIPLGKAKMGEWFTFSDPELTQNWISLRSWAREDRSSYEEASAQDLTDYIIQSMFSRRITKITEQKNAPFLSARLSKGKLFPGWKLITASVDFKDGKALEALEALEKELASAGRFGFTQEEMDRETKALEGYIKSTYDQRGDRQHQWEAGSLVDHFMEGEPVLTPEANRDLGYKLLKTLTLEKINRSFVKDWIEGPRNQILSQVKKEGNPLPSAKDLDGAVERGRSEAVPPAGSKKLALMDRTPVPGKVIAEEKVDDPGLTVWTLSNGARVIWKKTDYQAKRVLFRAVSFGGLSQVKTEDFPSAVYSLYVITQMGVGNLTGSELSDFLSDKQTSLSLGLGGVDESFSGSVETDRLEILFQLLNKRVTEPRLEKDQVPAFMEKISAFLGNRLQNPDNVFDDELDKILWNNHPRKAAMTLDDLKKFDVDKALNIYKERFSGAADFTYFFVGDFDPLVLKNYVETYIASLPEGPKEEVKDWGIRYYPGKISKEFKIGKSSQAKVVLFKAFYQPYLDANIPIVGAAEFILEKKLRESIREDLGASYGISVSVSMDKFPVGVMTLSIGFGTDAAKQETIRAQVKKVLEETFSAKVDPAVIGEFKLSMDRWYETGMKENGWWLDRIRNAQVYGRPWSGIMGIKESYGKVTPGEVEKLFAQLAKAPTEVEAVLLPGGK